MKIIHLLIPALVFSYHLSSAQTFLWVNHQTHVIQANPAYGIFPSKTDGAGNLTVGMTENFKVLYGINFYGDVALRRYSSSGTQLLSKVMTGKAVIDYVDADAQSNIYVSGHFLDTLIIDQSNILFNTGIGFNINYFLIKMNSSGSVLWKKNVNSIYGNDFGLAAIKVRGNFLYASIEDFSQGYIKKFDLNGSEQTSISISNIRVISGIDADANGNIYSCGSCSQGNINFGGLIVNCPNFYSLYFVKFNSTGSASWARFVEDVTFDSPRLVSDAGGNSYAAGQLNGAFWFGNIHASGPEWVYDFYVTKLDSSGTFIWLKEIPQGNSFGDASIGFANCIALDNSNNVYFTGYQRGTINWGSFTTVSAGTNDVLLLKFNTSGNLLWGRTAGGTMGERGDAISVDNNGFIYLTGNFEQSTVFDTIIVSGSGLLNSYSAKLSNPGITGVTNNQNIPNSFSLTNYPNPFNPSTKIKFDIPAAGQNTVPVKLVIYDILGRQVALLINREMKAGTYDLIWNAEGFPSGVYVYKLTAGDYSISKKMMLVK